MNRVLLGTLAGLFTLQLGMAATYSAILDGLQEVPPNASTGSGWVSAELTGSTLVLTGSFSNLVGSFSASHIHNAPAGSNGGVVVGLTPSLVDGFNGGYDAGNNTFSLSATQISELEAGNFYVNIHSTVYPGGELRGQLQREVTTDAVEQPELFSLKAAWPNPFNPVTTLSYSLDETMEISLLVHDLAGRQVASLHQGLQSMGEHEVSFDASGLASGVYFASLSAGGQQQMIKLTLLK